MASWKSILALPLTTSRPPHRTPIAPRLSCLLTGSRFRLSCAHTIFLDFQYAARENAEDVLWGLHTSINSQYRRVLARLKHNSNVVEKRKTEKMCNNFLRISQKFYKGYIQRLSARYDVKELQRAAHGIEVEQIAGGDTISPVPADLAAIILKSCYSTLLHLGDLARYRSQAKYKGLGFELAFSYYELARHLMPNSGFAHHQIGIVSLDEGNHLDVVYHFYRAWAVEIPHPNAKTNLESEFKSLRQLKSSKGRHSSSSAVDTLTMWFIKLHALFYKGESFSQQEELEGEVLHRLAMACRDSSSSNALLKMALLNISAHDIASAKLSGISITQSHSASMPFSTNTQDAESKAKPASRFLPFVLRFNALFLLTVGKALQSELEKTMGEGTLDESHSDAPELTASAKSLLPILRTYSMWLAASRGEVFGPGNSFGPLIRSMVQTLAQVFTLLCGVFYSQKTLATSPYLLSDDLELLGIRSLSTDRVPVACRAFCSRDDTLKPHPQDLDHEQGRDISKEHLGRVLDILRCAYFLAEDDSAPMAYRVDENQLIFEYQQDQTASSKPQTSAEQRFFLESAKGQPAQEAEVLPPRSPLPKVQSFGVPAEGNPPVDEGHAQTILEQSPRGSTREDDAENTVIAMLTPFLKPPTPPLPNAGRFVDVVPSDGKRAKGPTQGFTLHTIPSPAGSISSGKIAPLPWAWDNTPKPDDAQNSASFAGKEAFVRATCSSSPCVATTVACRLEDPFVTAGCGHSGTNAKQEALYRRPGQPQESASFTESPGMHRMSQLDTEAPSKVSTVFLAPDAEGLGAKERGPVSSTWPGSPAVRNHGAASDSPTTQSHQSDLCQAATEGVGLGVSGFESLDRSRLLTSTRLYGAPMRGGLYFPNEVTSTCNGAALRTAWLGRFGK